MSLINTISWKSILKILLISTSSSFVFANQVNLNADGRHGKNGQDGTDYSTYPGAGLGSGSNGGDATEAEPGADAGNIIANLVQDTPQSMELRISGSVDSTSIDNKLKLNSTAIINITANGGNGGHGGNGGDGQGGQNGSSGSNATRYSSGTNGGPGYNGGNGGEATSGKSGGKGGQVSIITNINDTHLLLAVECSAHGGSLGRAGQNGKAGSGGYGGSGGSSYSDSETVNDGETCTTESVSNGNGSYSSRRSCSPKYKTIYYHQSGGYSGSPGASGSPGSAVVYDGVAGKDGRCDYIVKDANGNSKTYSVKFDATIKSYTIEDANKDGIIEPGEDLIVKDLVIANNNGIPTPEGNAELFLYSESGKYLQFEKKDIKIPRILSGQTYQSPEIFKFNIKDFDKIGENSRWLDHDILNLNNTVTKVDRPITSLLTDKEITVSYPLEISEFHFPHSGAAGEQLKVFWKVKNISKKDFGGTNGLARQMTLSLEGNKNSSARPSDFIFTDSNGKTISLEKSYLKEILSLKAGETLLLEGQIKISKDPIPYTKLDVISELSLDRISTNKLRPIQQNPEALRISQIYKYNSESDILLITNEWTDASEFQAWLELCKNLNLKVNVWDTSYYGYLALSNQIKETHSSLQEHFKNKLIIFLNNDDSLTIKFKEAQEDFIKSISLFNVNILVYGGSRDSIKKMILASLAPYAINQNKKINITDKFLVSEIPQNIGEALSVNFLDRYYFSDPKEDDILSKAERLKKSLEELNPENRYVLTSYFDGSKTINESGVGTEHSVGTIALNRSLSFGGGQIFGFPLKDVHNANLIRSSKSIKALILALHPETQFKLINELGRNNNQYLNYLVQTLTYELVEEINREEILLDFKNRKSKPYEFLKNYIKAIKFFLEANPKDSTGKILFAKVVGPVLWYMDKLSYFSWSDWLGIPRKEILTLQKNIPDSELVDVTIKKIDKDLSTELSRREDLLKGLSTRTNMIHLLTYPAIQNVITSEILLKSNLLINGKEIQ